MAKARKRFAVVECSFPTDNDRNLGLEMDERAAYLQLWFACVRTTQHTFSKEQVSAEYVANIAGCLPELMNRTIVHLFAQRAGYRGGKLLVAGPRGAISVYGVVSKHRKLRGWPAVPMWAKCDGNATLMRHDCDANEAPLRHA